MSQPDHKKAWGDFWARNRRGGDGDSGGCLPARWAGIEDLQKAAWHSFAKRLPKGSRALDLATGDGRVMRWLLAKRRDLKLVGSDLAPELPEPPRGTKMRAGVAMEDLPFPDSRFGAITSQFGFEYGDTGKAADELARVSSPGALVGLMTHRLDGPILAHNLKRRAEIEWAINDQDLIAKAKNSLGMRAVSGLAVPPVLERAPAEGAAKFGESSAAWEIAEAIRRTLLMGARDNPARVAATLDQIGEQAANELGRIGSLQSACETAASPDFLSLIADAGSELVHEEQLAENGVLPFADFRIFKIS